MPPFLIAQRGAEIGRRFDIAAAQFTIGRGSDNELVLSDALVSRYHGVIRQDPDAVVIVDLGSTNPVLVNDTALEPGVPHRLQHRDVVIIGQHVFSYQNPAGATSTPRPPGRLEYEPQTMVAGLSGPGQAPLAPAPEPARPAASRSAARG